MVRMLRGVEIAEIQERATVAWHENTEVPQPSAPVGIILENHRMNFDLWHQEDLARDPEAGHEEIATVKHAIDRLNQRRHDLVEAVDEWILARVKQNETAPLHSETPGMMIDRLSILALKIYHTGEETHRVSASEEHRQRNMGRLALLEEQRDDLISCIDYLWLQLERGERRFKLYRQMKMYNDPELNPAVYGRTGS